MSALEAALNGKAGEALVAAELLRRHVDVAYPAYDGGVDLIAYREHGFNRVVPIQVKTRASTGYYFHKSWFHIEGLVLVHVWHVTTHPEFYIFSSLEQIEHALGGHAATQSWQTAGRWSSGNPVEADLQLMRDHRDKWERISDRLSIP